MTDPFDGLRDHARRTPPDLATIVELGSQRRRHAVLGASVTVLSLAVAAALSLGHGYGRDRGLDSVASTPGPSATSTPTPEPTASPAHPSALIAAGPRTSTMATPTPSVPPLPPPVGPSPKPSPSPKPGEAGMTRTYSGDTPPTVQIGTANMCATRIGTPSGSDAYCAAGATQSADAQGRVPIYGNTCRSGDQVTDGQLSFGTTREMDFAVFQKGKLVWRWSTGRATPTKYAHSLAVERGQCWVWETQWRAVDGAGKPRRGDFVLRTYAYANELMDTYRQTDHQFTL